MASPRSTTQKSRAAYHPAKIGKEKSFFKFLESVIDRLNHLGQIGTAKNYRSALNSISAFHDNRDLPMQRITPDLVEEYQAWLSNRGISLNSISFYMRILRATYRRAVESDLVADKHPFRHAYTKIERTAKRAIPIADIKRIKDLDLSQYLTLETARNIFLFLFYNRGMSFIDAAYLRQSDIKNGVITYRRHKTKQLITIAVNTHIEQLLTKFNTGDSDYVLPVITSEENTRRQYENALRLTNNALKKIARLAGISANLTTYTARHSWATIAKSKGVTTATISDALGHDSEKTTQIYLASISSIEINHANDLVLRDL